MASTSKVIEVEDKEILIRSSKGGMAIIPKGKVAWVKEQLKNNNHAALDKYVRTLPSGEHKKKAEDGMSITDRRVVAAPDATSVARPAVVANIPATMPYTAPPLPMSMAAASVSPDMVRENGTVKGKGFLGMLPSKNPEGEKSVSSELSIGSGDVIPGKEVLIPTMVPTLNLRELQHLLDGRYNPQARTGIDDVISKKAIDFARERAASKKPFFALPEEEGKFKINSPLSSRITKIPLPK
jgi:hypothetical protein